MFSKKTITKVLVTLLISTSISFTMPVFSASLNYDNDDSDSIFDIFKESGSIEYCQNYTLPLTYNANAKVQRINPGTGKLEQMRIYDDQGYALIDIDFDTHGWSVNIDNPHKHLWENGQKQLAEKLSTNEYIEYVLIPKLSVSSNRFTPEKTNTNEYIEKYKDSEYVNEKDIEYKITFQEFKTALEQHRDMKLHINNCNFYITYDLTPKGVDAFIMSYYIDFMDRIILNNTAYKNVSGVLKFRYHGEVLEDIWEQVSVIYID